VVVIVCYFGCLLLLELDLLESPFQLRFNLPICLRKLFLFISEYLLSCFQVFDLHNVGLVEVGLVTSRLEMQITGIFEEHFEAACDLVLDLIKSILHACFRKPDHQALVG
jgi:hypothetical protein